MDNNKRKLILLKNMFEMQKALNDEIMKEHELQSISTTDLELAILDEVGELVHELKGAWCWWKKTQKPVDRRKVLEELVDIWHFVLIRELEHYLIHELKANEFIDVYNLNYINLESKGITDLIAFESEVKSLIRYEYKLNYLFRATTELGFGLNDVYLAYLEKNQENYNRLKRGY